MSYINFIYVNTNIFNKPKSKEKQRKHHVYKLCIRTPPSPLAVAVAPPPPAGSRSWEEGRGASSLSPPRCYHCWHPLLPWFEVGGREGSRLLRRVVGEVREREGELGGERTCGNYWGLVGGDVYEV